ncbi:MAG: threonine/serine exporter family protein [Clostridia bacterium]|nr:threonine/serine exporter family protein [Clostridia bacterium]
MGISDLNAKDKPSRILALATGLGCKLLQAGSPVNGAERAVSAVCFKYGATGVSVFCIPDAIAVTATFSGAEYTSLKRAYCGGNDLLIQEKCFSLVRDILGGKLSINQAEARLKALSCYGGVPPSAAAAGSFLACGSFAIFFGGNAADGLIAALAGLITSAVSALLAKRGTGGCARTFLLSALSGLLSVLFCAFMQLIGVTCHVSLTLVGTLMTLIPGLAVCNALSDLISGEYFSGAYRILYGLAHTACIVAGYAIALTASGGLTSFTAAPLRKDFIHTIICYVTCSTGAAGFCLCMNARGKRLAYGVVASALCYTAYALSDYFGAQSFVCYFIAAATAYCAAQLPAMFLKIPSNVFVTPAVMPLLPGASMYFAVNALACGDTGTAIACGSDALVIFTAMAAGLAAAQLAARIILLKNGRRNKPPF